MGPLQQMRRWIAMSALMGTVLAWAIDNTRYPDGDVAPGKFAEERLETSEGVFKTVYVVDLQTYIDPTFKPHQKSILKDAIDIFMERNTKPSILDCAFSRSSKDRPSSVKEFEHKIWDALAPLTVRGLELPAFAFIGRIWDDSNHVGIAFQNYFYDTTKPLIGYLTRHYLHIAVNSDHLGFDSEYPLARDKEYWAGVIAHEFLHNLGYNHPTGYAGSFIEEYGNCIWTNGTSGEEPVGLKRDKVVPKDL